MNSRWQRPQEHWQLHALCSDGSSHQWHQLTICNRRAGAIVGGNQPHLWLLKKGQCQHGADAVKRGKNGRIWNCNQHSPAHIDAHSQHWECNQSQVWTQILIDNAGYLQKNTCTTMYTMPPCCRTLWKSWQERTGCANSKTHQHQEQAQRTQLLIQCHICKQWWMLTQIQTIQNQHMLWCPTAICPKRRTSHVDTNANPNHIMADARRTKKVQRSSMRRTPVPIERNSTAPNPIAYSRINACGTKKNKEYQFKSICDKLEVAFKPCHKFTADLGGYAEQDSNGLGSNWWCAGTANARENVKSEWIQVKYKNSPKTKLTSPVKNFTMHNAYGILSQSNDPIPDNKTTFVDHPPSQQDANIREHRRQRKIAWRQHI